MNEHQFGNRIRQALNQGMHRDERISARIAERLRAARERALERHRIARHEPAFGWARVSADGVLAPFGGFGGFSLRLLLPIALLVAGLIAIYGWQQEQRAADAEQLDALLLTGDLPIDAYLDRGFEAWLKKSSSR